jgi:hypothetical protein
MDEDRVREIVRRMSFSSGKGEMAIDGMAAIQPGLGRLMPEIGNRTWKLYYAGKAENWPNAMYQWKEATKLFETCAYTRPKHAGAIEMHLRDFWAPLEAAIEAEDLKAFLEAMDRAVDDANAWHVKKGKPFIVWKMPDAPPPDLDFTLRK